jgi:hypothetical protein
MKMLLVVAVVASAALIACTGSGNSTEERSSPTSVGDAAQLTSPTPTVSCPSPAPCPDCPEPTPCPGTTPCPTCPEPVVCPDCPTCPTCPTCPEPVVCPTCPACPQPVACPPGGGSGSDYCASLKVAIEVQNVLVDIADKGRLLGQTATEAGAALAQFQQNFDRDCQGVALAEPLTLAFSCAVAGKWKGYEEGMMAVSPDPQAGVWLNQFNSIINNYCTP